MPAISAASNGGQAGVRCSHVLVTRPQPQCGELAGMLEAAGVAAIEMPALGFAAPAQAFKPGPAWQHATRRLAVFTSPRAVSYALAGLPASSFADTLIAAIGPATAAALQDAGLQALQAPGGGFTSEDLLRLPELQGEPGQALVFAAPGGREALLSGLRERGWQAEFALVYRRVLLAPEPAALAALQAAGRVVSIWTSGAALQSLLAALPGQLRDRLLQGVLVVVSGRLAETARASGARSVQVAAGPDNTALLECALAACESGA